MRLFDQYASVFIFQDNIHQTEHRPVVSHFNSHVLKPVGSFLFGVEGNNRPGGRCGGSVKLRFLIRGGIPEPEQCHHQTVLLLWRPNRGMRFSRRYGGTFRSSGGVGGGELRYTGPEELDRVGPEGLEDGWKCRKKSCLLLRTKLVLQFFGSVSPDKRCSGSHSLDWQSIPGSFYQQVSNINQYHWRCTGSLFKITEIFTSLPQ